MQLNSWIQQYIGSGAPANITSPSGKPGSAVRMSSPLAEMKTGSVFEGTVNSVSGGRVVIGLSNGQTVSARLDETISLMEGQSLFFEVKSNDGAVIAIRPYTEGGNPINPTLVNALSMAGLPVDEENLSMVNLMMKNAMPIDRDSLAQMARLLSNNPTANAETVIDMKNLNIPITPEMVSQFENYANDRHMIMKDLNQFADQISALLTDESLPTSELLKTGSAFLEILVDELADGRVMGKMDTFLPTEENGTLEAPPPGLAMDANAEGRTRVEAQLNPGAELGSETLSGILSQDQILQLADGLKAAGIPVSDNVQNQDAAGFFKNIAQNLAGLPETGVVSRDGVLKLFQSDLFRSLVKEVLQNQWSIRPEELSGGETDKISKLYRHLAEQLDRIDNLVRMTGRTEDPVLTTSAQIRGNIEFMNQVNQMYQFVQLPLKMRGQTANGDLYVYRKPRGSSEQSEELSAFLHLDLENLGSTDVSVRLKNKNVDTKFYFDSEESYRLVMEHANELAERLKRKGYFCNIEVVNEGKKINFVQDFLKGGRIPTGLVHRYSFDMRA